MTTQPQQLTSSDLNYFAPSYFDRFMKFIERQSMPYLLTYFLFFLIQSAMIHLLAWTTGWIPAYTINSILFLFPIWQWVPLAIVTYSNSISRRAVSKFSPLLDVEGIEIEKLKYEFSTMPSRGVILSSVTWGIVYILLNFAVFDTFVTSYGLGSFLATVILLEGFIAYVTGSAIYYHSIRQLSLVNRTVKMVKKFNMFQLEPVYAFSRVTSFIGVSWMIMLSLTLLFFPIQFISGLVLVVLGLQVVLAVTAFALPLWFVHQRLETEKLELITELNRQVESTYLKLHRCLDNSEMGPVTQLKDALLGLSAERDVLNAMSTWPWSSGTLTGFLSTTILPIGLYLIQLVIQKLLGD